MNEEPTYHKDVIIFIFGDLYVQCNSHFKKVLNDSLETLQVYSKIYMQEQRAMINQDTPK